jgi:hypothetical protein
MLYKEYDLYHRFCIEHYIYLYYIMVWTDIKTNPIEPLLSQSVVPSATGHSGGNVLPANLSTSTGGITANYESNAMNINGIAAGMRGGKRRKRGTKKRKGRKGRKGRKSRKVGGCACSKKWPWN